MKEVVDAKLRTLNKQDYDREYARVNIDDLVWSCQQPDAFLAYHMTHKADWAAIWGDGLRSRLRGARVLELGAGNGQNALLMATLGAKVVAVDVSDMTPVLIDRVAARMGLTSAIEALSGEFLEMPFPAQSFDLVVGKAILHHLTCGEEDKYLQKIACILRPSGEARFAEPCVNSAVLDGIRWLLPSRNRPSLVCYRALRKYRAADHHPRRDLGSGHFRRVGARYYSEVQIECGDVFGRLESVLPPGKLVVLAQKWALRVDRLLPRLLRTALARQQKITYRQPRCSAAPRIHTP